MAFVITVCLPKGGVGKTTAAVSLATAIAEDEEGLRVGVIDYDTQGGVSRWAHLADVEAGEPLPCEVVVVPPRELGRWIRLHADSYDVLVIDGRPEDSDHNRLAARHADFVIIPTQPYRDSLDRLDEWHAFCTKYGRPHFAVITQSSPFGEDGENARKYLALRLPDLRVADVEMKWNPSAYSRSYGRRPGRLLTVYGRNLFAEITGGL